jgi:dephospho-CoA kinase
MAAQMSNDERSALVDLVFWNEGTLDDLFTQLDAALEVLGVGRD